MLRKIDCVMVRVEDVDAAARYYSRVFGLEPIWQYDGSVGLRFPESDAEVVLHSNPEIPADVDVTYLVDDVGVAVKQFSEGGCEVVVEPHDVRVGKVAVVRDPFGRTLTILDLSKGPVEPNYRGDN